MMQQGSWIVLGMEIECILLRLLPSVPSIDALAMKFCHGVKKKQTKNSQCQPIRPIHDKLQQTYNCFNMCGRRSSPPLIIILRLALVPF